MRAKWSKVGGAIAALIPSIIWILHFTAGFEPPLFQDNIILSGNTDEAAAGGIAVQAIRVLFKQFFGGRR